MEWISVKDRLPEEGEDVLFLVSPNGIPFPRIGHIKDGTWNLLCGMWNDYRPFTSNNAWPVTHWAPLPSGLMVSAEAQ